MQKGKVFQVIACILAVMLLFVAGCSGKTDSTQPSGTETQNTPAPAGDAAATDDPAMEGNMYLEGMPIVKDKITVRMMGMQMNSTRVGRWDETEFMMKMEEDTNIKVVWEMVPEASWQEKKNLIVASRELPDVFHGAATLSDDEAAKFGADGILIPLDDLIAKYSPITQAVLDADPVYDAFVRSLDGNIYALAQIQDNGFDSFNSACIKTEWLDQLGLPMPSTSADLENVLQAFKDNDLNGNGKADEIPFSFLYTENPPNREVKREHYWIFPMFGIMDEPRHVSIQDNGELIFTADKDEWKAAIKWMSDLYAKGLIDPEIFTQDRTLLTNKIRNEENIGLYTDYRLKSSMPGPEKEYKYANMPALTGPNGDKGWMRASIGFSPGTFAITNECENPGAAMRWLNYINEPENAVQCMFGVFHETGYVDAEACIPSETMPGKWDTNQGQRPSEIDPSNWPFTAPLVTACNFLTRDVMDSLVAVKSSNVAKMESCDVYRADLTKYPYNYPYKFTVDEIEELSLLQTDLLNYIYTTEAEWIINGNIDAEWDDYLSQLEKLDVDRYIELYKLSYERSLKK